MCIPTLSPSHFFVCKDIVLHPKQNFSEQSDWMSNFLPEVVFASSFLCVKLLITSSSHIVVRFCLYLNATNETLLLNMSHQPEN